MVAPRPSRLSLALGALLLATVAGASGSHVYGGDVYTLNSSALEDGKSPRRYTLREITDEKHLAELGLVSSAFNLGVMYAVNERYAAAEYWYRKAALRGHREAGYNLGVMYRNGQGMPRDDGLAQHWFEMAADRGLPQAQYQLGRICYETRGAPGTDPACERERYRQAAEGGYPLAQHDLAVLYHLGEGVAADEVEAYAWFAAADSNGFDCRDALAVVGATLSPEQLAAAKALAQRYVGLYVHR